jgi:hypothetical protein
VTDSKLKSLADEPLWIDGRPRRVVAAELRDIVDRYMEHERRIREIDKEIKDLCRKACREFDLTPIQLEVEIVKHRETVAPRRNLGRVYFLHVPSQDILKIGFSDFLSDRIKALSVAIKRPTKLVGSIDGDRVTERVIHHQFRAHRQHGEFFRWTPISEQVRGMVARNSGLLREYLQ